VNKRANGDPRKTGDAGSPVCLLSLLTSAGVPRLFFHGLIQVEVANKFVDLFLSDLLGHAVIFLDFSDETLPVPFNYIEVAVRKLAPLGSDLTLVLFPPALHLVPIHNSLL
jgi:hypothetical protein